MFAPQGVKRADGCHNKRSSNHSRTLVVQKHDQRPRVQQISSETLQTQAAIIRHRITHGMLHECIGHEDEIAGGPTAERHANGG